MTIPSTITNRLSIPMAGLIFDYLFRSDWPALVPGISPDFSSASILFYYIYV